MTNTLLVKCYGCAKQYLLAETELRTVNYCFDCKVKK